MFCCTSKVFQFISLLSTIYSKPLMLLGTFPSLPIQDWNHCWHRWGWHDNSLFVWLHPSIYFQLLKACRPNHKLRLDEWKTLHSSISFNNHRLVSACRFRGTGFNYGQHCSRSLWCSENWKIKLCLNEELLQMIVGLLKMKLPFSNSILRGIASKQLVPTK